ncbi:hypothetical protein BCR33DRAFT_728366 [Rhizoclosmatium globosum]|uniref:Uncharacterized protein n=1 Tax=Rhizoclosmatium globosum TaxID=329046 RepID=A0A1Y2AKD6_9FUNG|nr:hypothetical protein BCR33DRAFT_728366 [Rhizoclosmatium globosum]|eukprot:ORY22954.1 hypothetical protein BCR33DRAFT_728366 [Rhizoclosmatium globosum]
MVRLLVTDSRIDPSVHDNMAIPLVARYGGTHLLGLLLKDERGYQSGWKRSSY